MVLNSIKISILLSVFDFGSATFAHMKQMVKSYQNETDFVGELIRSDDFYLNNYSRYGCWCYLGLEYNILGMDKIPQSVQPVNQADSICHQLHNGYECIDITSRNEKVEEFNIIPEITTETSCHSRTVDYNLPVLTNQIWHDNKSKLTNKLVREACDLTNFDTCMFQLLMQ